MTRLQYDPRFEASEEATNDLRTMTSEEIVQADNSAPGLLVRSLAEALHHHKADPACDPWMEPHDIASHLEQAEFLVSYAFDAYDRAHRHDDRRQLLVALANELRDDYEADAIHDWPADGCSQGCIKCVEKWLRARAES